MAPLAAQVRESRDPARLAALDQDDPPAAALALAAAGFPVFPVHTVDADRRCGCGRECGRDAGKHPVAQVAPRGLLDATTDPATVAQWWALWPDANVAVRTGTDPGVWVLDVDAATGGEATVAALEARHGAFPPTWAVETGGGGLHLWWQSTTPPVPTSAGRVGEGVDVRGAGGYVVAPPSRHRSGERYRWGTAWSPALVPLALAPPWLLTLAAPRVEPRPKAPIIPPAFHAVEGQEGGNHPKKVISPLTEGTRNATLASLAGTMRRRGFSEPAILAALLVENASRCRPPLDRAEVEKVARSVARYAPESVPTLGGRSRSRPAFVEFVGGKAVAR